MLEDHVGDPRIGVGCHWRVVVAPQQPRVGVKLESLDAAMDWQAGSVIGLQHSVTKLSPGDVGSHQLIGERVVAPERIGQEIQEIQAIPFGGEARILEMFPSVGALLEELSVPRFDHHVETVEDIAVPGIVPAANTYRRYVTSDGHPCLTRQVDALA